MPHPSARTKYFLSWTKWYSPRKNFCPGLKTTFFCFQKPCNEYFLLKIDFQSGNFVLNDFWKQKMYFLTMDKIFILDNFSFVQDKKHFVRAEGRGKSLFFYVSILFRDQVDPSSVEVGWVEIVFVLGRFCVHCLKLFLYLKSFSAIF